MEGEERAPKRHRPEDPSEDRPAFVRSGVETMPAGHPDSWGAITEGTVLQGMPWPGHK
jgi:hypothetical protein